MMMVRSIRLFDKSFLYYDLEDLYSQEFREFHHRDECQDLWVLF